MKKYNVIFESKGEIISTAIFEAKNKKEAREKAEFHKRLTPEINKSKRVKITVN